jgi:hypothetical protein
MPSPGNNTRQPLPPLERIVDDINNQYVISPFSGTPPSTPGASFGFISPSTPISPRRGSNSATIRHCLI